MIGFAHEIGRGRPLDREKAIEFYERAGFENLYALKGLSAFSEAVYKNFHLMEEQHRGTTIPATELLQTAWISSSSKRTHRTF